MEIEVRKTPKNECFPGYSVSFLYNGVLLAVTPMGSPAYGALADFYKGKGYTIKETTEVN